MKQSRQKPNNFEHELQQKLQRLGQSRSHKKIPGKQLQLWSNTKIKTNINNNLNLYNRLQNQNQNEIYSNIVHTNQNDKINGTDIRKSQEQNQQHLQMPFNKNSQISQKSKTYSANSRGTSNNHDYIDKVSNNCKNINNINNDNKIKLSSRQNDIIGPFQMITNKQLSIFLSKNFDRNNLQEISLQYFVARCISQFTSKTQIQNQLIKQLYLQLQEQITTTDNETVSINALQLVLKKQTKYKNSLFVYINEKVYRLQTKILMENIRAKQIQIKEQNQRKVDKLNKMQNQLRRKQKQIEQSQNKMNQKTKQLIKKQKILANKDKQFSQKVKNAKKQIQQKCKSLTQTHIAQLNDNFDKISGKINVYQRNMKYRVEALTNKANQIHRLHNSKQDQFKSQTIKQTQEKYDKMYSNKIKKYQSQIKQLFGQLQKQKQTITQLVQQNKRLLKIINKNQLKINKQNAKLKQMSQQISRKQQVIKYLQLILMKKQQQKQQIVSRQMLASPNSSASKLKSNHKIGGNTEPVAEMGNNQNKRSLSHKSGKKSLSKKKTQISFNFYELISCYQEVIKVLINKNTTLLIQQMQQQQLTNICQIIVRALLIQNYACQHLVSVLLLNLTFKGRAPCKNKQISLDNQIKANFNQMLNKIQKNTNINILWKLCTIFYLGLGVQNQIWLNKLSQICQRQPILNNIIKWVQNNQENNLILAIIDKFTKVENYKKVVAQQNFVQRFVVFSQLLIDLNAVYHKYCTNIWQHQYGIKITEYFIQIVKRSIKDQNYFNKNVQSIQRISIMIQRLFNTYTIQTKKQNVNYLHKLLLLSKGSLLQQNLKSIIYNINIQQHNQQNNRILDQIDDQQ